MARIRTVKPEFWTSEQVVECSPIARLMFIGMWNFCDDAGNHPASYKTLKMEVFPGDEISLSQIQGYANELLRNGLLINYYGGNGREYWHVTGWNHQKIEKPNYKHPPYIQLPIDNHSTIDQLPIDNHSTPEGKGRERKGKDKEEYITHTYYPSKQSRKENENNSQKLSGDQPTIEPKPPPGTPTPAASVCLAIKKIGIIDINPSHPDLLMLIEAGATIDEFVYAARTAKDKGKGFAYILGTVKGQRSEAKKTSKEVFHGEIKIKNQVKKQGNDHGKHEAVEPV